jgi:hypothetical protein
MAIVAASVACWLMGPARRLCEQSSMSITELNEGIGGPRQTACYLVGIACTKEEHPSSSNKQKNYVSVGNLADIGRHGHETCRRPYQNQTLDDDE